jgi:hypothetical protein
MFSKFLHPGGGASFAEFTHERAPRKTIIVGRGEHHPEPMILGSENAARLVGNLQVCSGTVDSRRGCGTIVWYNITLDNGPRMVYESSWQICRPMLPRTLQNGERTSWFELLMRAENDGAWVYRQATQAEIDEHILSLAW